MSTLIEKHCSVCKKNKQIFLFTDVDRTFTVCNICRSYTKSRYPIKQCSICGINARYAINSNSNDRRCKAHKDINMFDVTHKKCTHDGCKKIPVFNNPGELLGVFCFDHKLPGMVDVKNKNCTHEGCKKRPNYGYVGQSSTYCFKHKMIGMYTDSKRICIFSEESDCKETATYGIKEPLHCEYHIQPKEICLLIQECKGCHRTDVILDLDGLCLLFCRPNELYQVIKREKKYENLTLKYLDKYIDKEYHPIDDHVIDSFCNRKRPDRVYDCGTHFVVIEVDENQHKGYNKSNNCELVRMHQIYESLGMHCTFLRFNPNNFRVGGKLSKINLQVRLDTLKRWVEWCIKTVPIEDKNMVQYKFLFYDEYEEADMGFIVLDDFELY